MNRDMNHLDKPILQLIKEALESGYVLTITYEPKVFKENLHYGVHTLTDEEVQNLIRSFNEFKKRKRQRRKKSP